MGITTGIEWTDATWNPWRGCTKVSEGCRNCYMYREQRRYGRDPTVVMRGAPTTFNEPMSWERRVDLRLPFPPDGRIRTSLRVFTCSWSDFFHEAADGWRAEAWSIIKRTPHLTYQILTKRPERISSHLPADWGQGGYPNVWLGTSAENGHLAFTRGLPLSQVHARVHFLSAEPALGPYDDFFWAALNFYDWVILGGESGAGARPLNPEWARQVRDGTKKAGKAFFFKLWGGPVGKKGDHEEAVLDGVTWKEMPEVAGE